MTFIQRVLEALDANLFKFVKLVHSTNREFPYHDFYSILNTEEEAIEYQYVVGQGNIAAHGDQHKYFVSKRMLIISSSVSLQIHLNDKNNVNIGTSMVRVDFDGTDPHYFWEFHTNINVVFITAPAGTLTNIYCEGVLPQEARDAE